MRLLDRIRDLSVLRKKKNAYLVIIGGVGLVVVSFSLIFTPLKISFTIKRSEWKKIEAQLIVTRPTLDSYSKLDKSRLDAQLEELRKRLPSKDPTSTILDELTKRGKELNIEFVTITPQLEKIPTATQTATSKLKYKILPIEINMKATYRNLAEYLGILENLENGFTTVGGFQIRKDEKIFPKLNVKLVVHTYILPEDKGGQK